MGWLTRFFCGNYFEVRNQIRQRASGVGMCYDDSDDEFE